MGMKLTPAVIVDILLLAVIVLTTVYYHRKGFLAGVLDLVANFLSIGLAWYLSGRVSPGVFENFFKSGLIDTMARTVQQQGGVNLNAVLSRLSGILPQQMLDDIAASASGLLNSHAPDLAQRVVEEIIAPLVIPLITVVVFFATFLLCRVVAAMLVTALKNTNKLPLIGGVNKLLGLAIGVVIGIIHAVVVLCLLWAVVVITNGTLPGLNDAALSGSRLYALFASYNPFF